LLALAARAVSADRPAAAWTDRDIGSPSVAGSADVNTSGVWRIQGSSTFLGIQADHLHFTSQSIQGDASITARFLSMKGGHGEWSRAGLMVRANESPGSPDFYLAMTPAHSLMATSRLVQDSESRFLGLVGPSTSRTTTLFMRLQRSGSDVAGFYSRDGVLWYQAGFPPQTLAALPDTALWGPAVTSQLDGALTTGTFDSVEIDPGATAVYGLSSCGGDQAVTLQWRPLKNATAYNVYRGPLGAARDGLIQVNSSPVAGTSFTDRGAGLVNGTAQTYAVAALFPGSSGGPVEGPLVTVTGTPVAAPAGFIVCSMNEGVRSGSANFDPTSGAITLSSSGVLTFDTADGCYFLSQPITGDIQATVKALTRPIKPSDWAVAGLMLRESLDAGSRYAAVWTTASRRLFSQWRGVTNGFAGWPGFFAIDNGALKTPVTLRLTRRGSTVTPEYSTDNGQTFLAAGPPVTFDPPLGQTVYIGAAIASADRGTVNQATFSNLELK
jgi:regulation of enolase protein 1 (concanavalin A-like superfamily)